MKDAHTLTHDFIVKLNLDQEVAEVVIFYVLCERVPMGGTLYKNAKEGGVGALSNVSAFGHERASVCIVQH